MVATLASPLLRALAAAAIAVTLCGCAGDPAGTGDPGLPEEFPAEKSAADFSGRSYAAHDGPIPRPRSGAGPVWLVAVDGATWDLIRPGIDRGELPNFARMVDQGAHGVLRSEEPTISPALWATIATGMPRFVHGVVNFVVRVPGRLETVPAGPLDRRSPAVWELVQAAGGRSAVLSWFGSFPAEEIDGVYLSKGLRFSEPDPRQVHPDSWVERLRERGEPAIDPAWIEALAPTPFLRRTLEEDVRTLDAWRAVIADPDTPPVDLLAVYFSGTDVVQHMAWSDMDPASRAFPEDRVPDPSRDRLIPDYYRFIDEGLGEILDAAPADATIVLLSDHGAGPMRLAEAYHLQLETLLESMGLLEGGGGELLAISEPYRYDKRIWLNVEGLEPQGRIAAEAIPGRTDAIRRRLDALRTDEGAPVFASIVDHVAEGTWQPGDAMLTVRFTVAALLAASIFDGETTLPFAPVRLRHTDVSGSHRPDGILVMSGPEIRPGALAEPATLYHIAPTLLYLLGLPQDRRMLRWAPAEGGVLEAAIAPECLQRRPVRMVAEYPGTDRQGRRRSTSSEAEWADPSHDEALDKLRSLGYIR